MRSSPSKAISVAPSSTPEETSRVRPFDVAVRLGVETLKRMRWRVPRDSEMSRAIMIVENILRMTSCSREMRSHSNEPWMSEVLACQEEVLSTEPGSYYSDRYRRREVSTWLWVAKWIYEEESKLGAESCLDIGCGYGTFAVLCKRVLGCEISCVDVEERPSARRLAGKIGLDLKLCNIETDELPWRREFDIIIFTEVMEHLNFNPVSTLRKIRDSLAPGGRLYLSTPDASEAGKVMKYYDSWMEMPQPIRGKPFIDDHVYQYSKEELFNIADQAGLRVKRLAYAPGHITRHFNLVLMKKED